jgi:copper chaperone CopZ
MAPLQVTAAIAVPLLAAQIAGFGQVAKVEILTSGISCGICAAVSEFQFRRMPAVKSVAISLPNESITISYKSGAAFSPRAIHEVLNPLHVQVLRLRIEASGYMEESKDGKRYLVCGQDRFQLRPSPKSEGIEPGVPLMVDGVVIERRETLELLLMKVSGSRKQ